MNIYIHIYKLMNRFKRREIRIMGTKALYLILIITQIVPTALLYIHIPVQEAEAATAPHIITSRVDFNRGNFDKTETKSKEGEIRLETDGSWTPRIFRSPDVPVNNQTAIATASGNVYILPGQENRFMRYIPSENRWQNLATAPHTAYTGASMTVVGNYIYAIFGGYTNYFSRYNIITNTWSEMAPMLDVVNNGAAIESDGGNYIYAIRGDGKADFWRYDITAGTWGSRNNTNLFNVGADLVHDGNNSFYVLQGNGTGFWRYDPSGNSGSGSWTSRAVIPQTANVNHNISFNGGYVYVTRDGTAPPNAFIYRYDPLANSWATLASMPQTAYYVGSVPVKENNQDYLYIFRGNGSYDFWKYEIASNQFVGYADLPIASTYGSDLVYLGNKMFYGRPGSNTFYSLDITSSSSAWVQWTADNAPGNFLNTGNDDSKAIATGSAVFYYQGYNQRNFWSFDPSNTAGSRWKTEGLTPATVLQGASLVYATSSGKLFGTRGGGQRSFWRFDFASGWNDAAAADLPATVSASFGSRMVSDGTDVYLMTGYLTNQFWKYTVGTDTWSQIGDGNLPFASYWGTDATFSNGRMYVQAGYMKTDFWSWSESTGWIRMPDLVAYSNGAVPAYNYQRGPYYGASLESDSRGNLFSTYGMSMVQLQTFRTSSYLFPVSGVWTSDVIDLSYVQSWTSMSATTSLPSGSSVTLEARTSADKITWTGWDSTITNLTPQRYIQVRATLNATGDRSQTPVVSAISISYVGDEVPPTNPTTFTGYSKAAAGVVISSGVNHKYPTPYFTWSGATDDIANNVAGYYVYFGIDSNAIASDSGTFQTSATYLVTEEMIAGQTYYFRIQTKDNSNNISVTETKFVYPYSGVSPPLTEEDSYTTEFETGGIATNVNISNNEIKLATRSSTAIGFWQQERFGTGPTNVATGLGAGLAYSASQNKMYMLRGGNTQTFYEYDLATDVWTAKDNTLAVTSNGAIADGPNGYLYALQGNATNGFWLYTIGASSGTQWSQTLAQPDQSVRYGSAMVYDGSRYVYAFKGNVGTADDYFMRYDNQGDGWEQLANTDFGESSIDSSGGLNLVSYGGELAYDTTNNVVYGIQGNLRHGFASYDPVTNTWTPLAPAPALAYTGAQLEYDATSQAIYYLPGWNTPYLYKYDITSQTWTELPEAPVPFTSGTAMKNVNGVLYVVRGGTNPIMMYKYNIAKASWMVPTMNLFGDRYRGTTYFPFSTGADMVKGDGENYYIVRGNVDNIFVRYNAVTGETVKLHDVPAQFSTGGDLEYVSTQNKIYAITNSSNSKFYVYDIATDQWSELPDYLVDMSPTPYTRIYPAAGSTLTFDGSRYIYFLRSGGNQTFYRYDLQGTDGSRWSDMANITAAAGAGSDMVVKGGELYTLRGNTQSTFYKFTPNGGTGTWTTLTSTGLGTIGADGFLVDAGQNRFMACRGQNTVTCYYWNIGDAAWTAMENAPTVIGAGGGAASNGNDRILMISGGGTNNNSYTDGVYSYILQSQSTGFKDSGSYISPSLDLGTVYTYANLHLSYQSATNSALTIYTRSSNDNATWSNWVLPTQEKIIGSGSIKSYEYKISSANNRYIQTKFEITSGDGIYSGVIKDYSVSYYRDELKPNNPTHPDDEVAYSDASHSAALISGSWDRYPTVYFDWPDEDAVNGASDGASGSGIAGYYVYFGTSASANASDGANLITSSEYIATPSASGGTYYFKLQAVDAAGNIAATNWEPFTYKYDLTAPTMPTSLTVNPLGYSGVNNYTFTWSGATDAGSGISGYYYKTCYGDPEVCTDDQWTTTATVSGALAVGNTNTFFVKTKDTAGNTSSYKEIDFFYTSGQMGPPQSLRAFSTEEEDGIANDGLTKFTWLEPDPATYPESMNPNNFVYYYSINKEPKYASLSGELQGPITNSVRELPFENYATQDGENKLYVVTWDGTYKDINNTIKNINYDVYARKLFYTSTAAPGAPRNLTVEDISDKENEQWRVVLSWLSPTASGSGIQSYQILRSTTTDADCTTTPEAFSELKTINPNTTEVDAPTIQDTYYYCVKACAYRDGTSCSAASNTVSKFPDGRWTSAPELVGSQSATVKTKSALITWTTNRSANTFVKYGTKSGDYPSEAGSSTQTSYHELTLTGLNPGTKYYYQMIWTDEDGNEGKSEELTFTTNPAPFVSNVKATETSIRSTYITFTSKNGIKATVQYGKTLSYGGVSTISVSKSETTNTIKLDNLLEGTIYHYRIVVEDDEGNTFAGDDYIFETLPVPKVVGLKVQQVAGMATATIRLIWTSNTAISSIVTYYPTDTPVAARDQISLTLKKTHEVILTNLKDDTEYTIVVKGRDKAGNEAVNPATKIKTAVDFRPPEIANMIVESTIVGIGEDARAQIIVSWDTDEPSTTQVEYAQGTGVTYSQTTQEDSALTTNHVVTIPGLSPSKIYHLRAVSKDKANNIAQSEDTVTITPKSTKDALNLVIDNLAKTFGFLRRIQ